MRKQANRSQMPTAGTIEDMQNWMGAEVDQTPSGYRAFCLISSESGTMKFLSADGHDFTSAVQALWDATEKFWLQGWECVHE